MSFTWTSLIPHVGNEYSHVATAGIASAALVGIGFYARKKLGFGQEAATPTGTFSIRGALELITEFITGLADSVIGHHGRIYVPMFASVFLFVLFNNLLGVIPGLVPATENFSTTFAMGLFIFLAYNFLGIKANGMAYFKHFVGPVWWLFWLMIPLELISHFVRPVSLGFRLANVMMGDHTVLGVFTDMWPHIGLPVLFYILGLIVSFVQAFVFTLLSMVYVALATAHDH